MGKTKISAVQGASGAGVGRVFKSTAGLRAGHQLSQKLHRVGSEHCLSQRLLRVIHGPASSKLEAARHVTCLQKETSDINIAVEVFIIVSGLELGAEFGGGCGRDDGGSGMLFYQFPRRWRTAQCNRNTA